MKPAHALLALTLTHVVACASTAGRIRTGGGTAVPVGTTQGGLASYYSDSLAGGTTASGERYDPDALTAAHRTLPLGTRVLVRRTDRDRAVEVRINDRGPYASARRVIDLSRAAATALDMLRVGVAPVEVRVIALPPARRNRH